ncbi:Na(+)-translocating NADH-quinone reductase subunit F [Abyssalbus ytuae]|uniref:Na(+)-translocating NADH-quinone reductase subunit F n=1 Tax=Abyssalbus ytuae TaxID=2926907 RepID=A0A9E7CTN4_9FLAO|nr:Na(+)-translocating NADH-quinone reductase subunit F [Abyssalbus ytuae]UOB18356.1 Na(+)-translocating NADH-quinone reductase subunit F [Abyssalbus ytuae]
MNVLSEQELHYLAMNIVGKDLETKGFEFLSVNSKPKKNPQFVCLKDKKIHFIIVRAVKYPEDPNLYDKNLVEKVKDHANKFNAITYYAGVALANADDYNKPIIKNQKYIVDYHGIIKV